MKYQTKISVKIASILCLFFTVSAFPNIYAAYTLTNDDVVVVDGIIESCSYDFAIKDIVIPESLDEQTVTGIASEYYYYNGVFYNKGITSLQLPSTLERIGQNAFTSNDISSVNFSDLTQLIYIGEEAFNENDLASLDFSSCIMLHTIMENAFGANSASTLILPAVSITGFDGWVNSSGEKVAENQEIGYNNHIYKALVPYTLTSDDVEVVNGEIKSCSYNFDASVITIPSILDGQEVTAIADGSYFGVFSSRGIVKLVLPNL
jgi:hypothetical protein